MQGLSSCHSSGGGLHICRQSVTKSDLENLNLTIKTFTNFSCKEKLGSYLHAAAEA